jgi:hypothetical protein
MTYHARGRSITEVIIAVIFVGFLTGFVAVLCIGNYFRAKRAVERQRQRRLARLSNGGSGYIDSPRSHYSSATSGGSPQSGDEYQHLLSKTPDLPRRRVVEDEGAHLLAMNDDTRRAVNLMSV